ncbi:MULTISPECIES: FG-GAP-like repeat-containing protein [Okeania]|uniref:DUF4347 domain-containing protein n=2 Tax=Okeania TaxID=1458928 RepID=A0A3N6QRG8_9CYAN|nr:MULTISPECIES: FG-GAP-like repeat-containing protein [Okeania]NET75152.1 DUF4347 domain-containing protein [Okeania sp. SIO1F9]RQH25731.1 DUF4347 domain-containing protein [Okeania hirsuta]RQH51462.1 DUF4347 domain-containing protein [Okeania hirsuta]
MIFTRKDDTNFTTTVREITAPKKTKQTLVIIDRRVDNYQQLVSGTYPETKVVVLDVRKDGIEQITGALSDELATSLHVVCHGADGILYLGKTPVSQENIYQYRGLLQEWAVEEILLYGCNVGGDRQFLNSLHELTGANIAASAHRVGNIAKGGSWQLEIQIGQVNYGLAFLPEVIQEYSGVFAVSFSEPTNFAVGDNPLSIAVGEFNGDGNLDLATANGLSNDVSVLLGNGDGTFAAPTNFAVGDNPLSIAVGEFNGDGNLDLATANVLSDDVSVLLGNGDGSFAAPTNFAVGDNPLSIAVGEFNGDGNLDLATANYISLSGSVSVISVLLGNGDGSFAAPTNFELGDELRSITVGEFNGDDNLDLAVANYFFADVSVLLGNGDGSFTAPTNFEVGDFPLSIAVGEFNGDGNLDLAVTNEFDVSVLLGNGDGSFAARTNFETGYDPTSIAVGEFNRDGNLDLATTHGFSNDVSVLLGNGDGSFANPTTFATGGYPGSIAVGEFNGDDYLDLVMTNSHDVVSILLNTTGPPGTPEDDNLSGTSRNELIDGLAGNDTIDGAGGNDTLLGNTDNDSLIGGAGDDQLDGGSGIDMMIGGPGNDYYVVDNSEDTVTELADAGNDTVNSSITYTLGDNLENLNLTGNDAINGTGNSLDNTITDNIANNRVNGNDGNDILKAGGGDDTVNGGSGADQIIGGRGNDLLRGNDGNDTLEGRPGFDILLGGNGDDILTGGIGRDRLNGGAGNDTLTGGASIDRFIFNTNQEFETPTIGIDTITDFDVQRDLILLDKKTFTALESDAGEGFSVETDFAIVESDDAVATNGAFIVYNSASGALFYNPNGSESGLGDGAQFAVLNNDASLEANNFQIR